MTIAAKMIKDFEVRYIKQGTNLNSELSQEDIRKQILIAKYMKHEEEIKAVLYECYKCPIYCIELDLRAQEEIAHILGTDMQYGGGRELVEVFRAIGFSCQSMGARIEAIMSVDF